MLSTICPHHIKAPSCFQAQMNLSFSCFSSPPLGLGIGFSWRICMGSISSAENSCPEATNLPFHSISNRNIIKAVVCSMAAFRVPKIEIVPWACHLVIRFRSDSVLPVPARGVAEVALGLYCKTLFIYRTCVHPVLPRPARVPCVKHTLMVQCNTKRHFALQRAHLKLHLSHARSILHTPHFTLHLRI